MMIFAILFLTGILFLLICLSDCIPMHEVAPEEEYERVRAILRAEEPTEETRIENKKKREQLLKERLGNLPETSEEKQTFNSQSRLMRSRP